MLIWDITNRCNLSCAHCFNSRYLNDGKAPDFNIEEVVEQIAKLKVPAVRLHGGEPLLFPKVVEVVRRLREKGMLVYLTTNATLLTEEMARALLENGLNKLSFSIENATPEINDRMRGEGTFVRAMRGIHNFFNVYRDWPTKIDLSIFVTMTKHNITCKEDIFQIFALAKELGIPELGFVFVVPSGRGIELRDELDSVTRVDIAEWVGEAAQQHPEISLMFPDKKILTDYLRRKYDIKITGTKTTCPAGDKVIYMNHELKFYPCNFVNNYNLAEETEPIFHFDDESCSIQNAEGVMNSPDFVKFRELKEDYLNQAPEMCKKCVYFKQYCFTICPFHFATLPMEDNKRLYVNDCIEVKRRLQRTVIK